MTNLAAAMRSALECGDPADAMWVWAMACPHLPQPDATQALTVLHIARTEAESVSLAKRQYSHRWLTERSLPSRLPDRLRPNAEQVCPKLARAVGIAFVCRNPATGLALPLIEKAMQDAVLEAASDNRLHDSEFVKQRMHEAQHRERRALGLLTQTRM